MEYAESLVLGARLVHCTEVSYEDCANRQIVCPACREPVFKAGNQFTQRQYLSHYTRKPGADCEFRVMVMAREQLTAKLVMPHGQTLEKFLRAFEDIVLFPLPPELRQGIDLTLGKMRHRPTWRQLIFQNRQFLREVALDGQTKADGTRNIPYVEILANHSPHRNANGSVTTGDPELAGAIKPVLEYIFSANSFAALLFAASYGVLYTAGMIGEGLVRISETHLDELIDYGDYALRRYLAGLTRNEHFNLTLRVGMTIAAAASQFVIQVMVMESKNAKLERGNEKV